MQHTRRTTVATALALTWAAASTSAFADSFLDQIGITQLRVEAPYLTGTGIIIAQPEATNVDVGPPYVDFDNFEISPNAAGVAAPIYYLPWNNTVNSTTFTPSLESNHADTVASFLAGNYVGVAPTIAQILNFNANLYVQYIVQNYPIDTPATPQVINQSFTQNPGGPYTADVFNQCWDSFAAKWGQVIVSGAGNSGDVQVPATAYNVIAVGTYGGASSVSQAGQLAKPEIVVAMPAGYGFTSFSTPVVSGTAALLLQAGSTMSNPNDATDPRTIKALLLNGAVKPGDWSHSTTVPLDRRYGAGLLNALNAYHNLIAGENTPTATTATTSLGGVHSPTASGSVSLTGWNLGFLNTTATSDSVDHYVLDLPAGSVPLILTATLVWQRAANDPLTNEIINATDGTPAFTSPLYTINNLDLFLYNADTQALVDQSTSTIDSVEHLYSLSLNPGKYDLQVLKNGGTVNLSSSGPGKVFSISETYALAWSVSNITTVNSVANYTSLVFTQSTALTVGAAISGAGTLTQSGSGTTTLTGSYSGTGPVAITAGKLTFGTTSGTRQTPAVLLNIGTLTVAANAKLDVTNHDLLIGSTTLADVQGKILAGVGLASGGAITTSTAQTPQRMFLVPVNAVVGQSYDGVQVTQSGSVFVKYTFIGDLNLDGRVDGLDFGIAQNHLNQTTPGLADFSAAWVLGDVTLSGKVDGLDLATMAENLGAGYSQGVLDPQFIPIGSTMPVPEPATLLLLGAGGMGLLLSRRRAGCRTRTAT
jgi:hypothetical protein